jgi:hypothetical protein
VKSRVVLYVPCYTIIFYHLTLLPALLAAQAAQNQAQATILYLSGQMACFCRSTERRITLKKQQFGLSRGRPGFGLL